MSSEQVVHDQNPVEHHTFFKRILFAIWYRIRNFFVRLIPRWFSTTDAPEQKINAPQQKKIDALQQAKDLRQQAEDPISYLGDAISHLRDIMPQIKKAPQQAEREQKKVECACCKLDRIQAKIRSVTEEHKKPVSETTPKILDVVFTITEMLVKDSKKKAAEAVVKIVEGELIMAQAELKSAQVEVILEQAGFSRPEARTMAKKAKANAIKLRAIMYGEPVNKVKLDWAQGEVEIAEENEQRARQAVSLARASAQQAKALAQQKFKSFVNDSGESMNQEEEGYLIELLYNAISSAVYSARYGDFDNLEMVISDIGSEPTKHLIVRTGCDHLLLEIITNDDEQFIQVESFISCRKLLQDMVKKLLQNKRTQYEQSICGVLEARGELDRTSASAVNHSQISPASSIAKHGAIAKSPSSSKKEKDDFNSLPPTCSFMH